MLDWISSGQSVAHSPASRTFAEGPETPAPVFAFRAFKSALFGTPRADNDIRTEATPRPSPESLRGDQDKKEANRPPDDIVQESDVEKPEANFPAQPLPSPTKSILVTPGTVSKGRKTVSFGEEVVDNERKRVPALTKASKPLARSSSQWTSSPLDDENRPRSKLTQTLFDARSSSAKSTLSSQQTNADNKLQETGAIIKEEQQSDDAQDETINLDEPRSQSGKYWKAEFESYRANTNREIKRLIQYRSFAKQYARKKEAEAMRLADKLREEEAKVAEMERHVTHLASRMVSNGVGADKEQVIQELTRQTALALQYKHRATLLRKMLERYGVVGAELDNVTCHAEKEAAGDRTVEELHKSQLTLAEANSKIEEMKQQQRDLKELQHLARISGQKASELEKENALLKERLVRYKQEMTRYEGRRVEKEKRLRQREAKLETKIQECRERIKQYRASEGALKKSFAEERCRMQEQIELLKHKAASHDYFTQTGDMHRSTHNRQFLLDTQTDDDFTLPNGPALDDEPSVFSDPPPSPSPRSKERPQPSQDAAIPDVGRNTKNDVLSNDHSVPTRYEAHPSKAYGHRLRKRISIDLEPIPPSSPPDFPEIERSARPHLETQPRESDDIKNLPNLPLNPNTASLHPSRFNTNTMTQDDIEQARLQRSIRNALASMSAFHPYPLSSHNHRISTGQIADRDVAGLGGASIHKLSPERIAAAKARLRRKGNSSRRAREDEKEHAEVYHL